MSISKEVRLLKSAKSSIDQAQSMLQDVGVENVEVMMLRNAATQATQAAMELSQLIGMLDSNKRIVDSAIYKFNCDVQRFDIPGRGIVYSMKCPTGFESVYAKHINRVVEINGDPWHLTGVECQGTIKPGSNIGLVVRALTSDETVSYKISKQLEG